MKNETMTTRRGGENCMGEESRPRHPSHIQEIVDRTRDIPVNPAEVRQAEEGLRLNRAFRRIAEPERRLELIELAERYAHPE